MLHRYPSSKNCFFCRIYRDVVNPEYKLVEKDGQIVDVEISYPTNYAEQHLHYSKEYSFLPSLN